MKSKGNYGNSMFQKQGQILDLEGRVEQKSVSVAESIDDREPLPPQFNNLIEDDFISMKAVQKTDVQFFASNPVCDTSAEVANWPSFA